MSDKEVSNPVGRPTVMTEEVIGKLEQAFLASASDEQACLFAGIHPSTLYDYQALHPEFTDRKNLLKQQTVLQAKFNVSKAILDGDKAQSNWYLERKAKGEFGNSSQHVSLNIDSKDLPDEDKERLKKLLSNN